MYTITPSRNEEYYVVTFQSKESFDELADKLTEEYNFKDNKNNTAITAKTIVNGHKVALTLYKNNKLLIQGAGSEIWTPTVFKQLTAGLAPTP